MDGAQKTVAYTYDPVGNRSRMTDPDGGRCTYAYDASSQLTVLRNPQEDCTSFSYDVAGRRTLKELANGTKATMIYDAAGSLTRIANLKSDNSVISQYDYSYNAAGKRTRIAAADGSVTTYSYDSIYQLTREQRSASESSWSGLTVDGWGDLTADGWSTLQANDAYDQRYQYDANLNRTVKDLDGTRTTVTYDAADQIRYQLNAAGRTTYTFDANGNEILVLTPTGARTTTMYDVDNRTTQIWLPDSTRNTMTYNPDGLRIKLSDSSGTTKFLWDGAAYLSESNASNTTQAVYTQEPGGYGGLVSQYRNNGSLWVPSYDHYDGLGNTLQLTDAGQNVTDTYLYNAFGELLSQTGTTVNPFRFGGYWGYFTDPDTGHLYIRARTYVPSQGRWTTVDILLFVNGPNVYMGYFVPNGVDPSGMDGFWGGFGNSIGQSIGSMQNAFGGMYLDIGNFFGMGNEEAAQEMWNQSYEAGVLGQTQDSAGIYYYGTRGSLGIGAAAAGGAAAIGAAEVVFLENKSILVEGCKKGGRIIQLRIKKGRPLMRLDYHAFKDGGRKVLHLDSEYFDVHHWPWGK